MSSSRAGIPTAWRIYLADPHNHHGGGGGEDVGKDRGETSNFKFTTDNVAKFLHKEST